MTKALVIYGPQHVPFDVDLGPIMLHDWRHLSYEDVVAEVKAVRINDIVSTEVRTFEFCYTFQYVQLQTHTTTGLQSPPSI